MGRSGGPWRPAGSRAEGSAGSAAVWSWLLGPGRPSSTRSERTERAGRGLAADRLLAALRGGAGGRAALLLAALERLLSDASLCFDAALQRINELLPDNDKMPQAAFAAAAAIVDC